MKTNILHTITWQNERRSTLALGYCFNSINTDVQGKPSIPGQCNIDV
jgi:hypothetical protein